MVRLPPVKATVAGAIRVWGRLTVLQSATHGLDPRPSRGLRATLASPVRPHDPRLGGLNTEAGPISHRRSLLIYTAVQETGDAVVELLEGNGPFRKEAVLHGWPLKAVICPVAGERLFCHSGDLVVALATVLAFSQRHSYCKVAAISNGLSRMGRGLLGDCFVPAVGVGQENDGFPGRR